MSTFLSPTTLDLVLIDNGSVRKSQIPKDPIKSGKFPENPNKKAKNPKKRPNIPKHSKKLPKFLKI